jgi:hypothetical protein
VDCQQSLGGIVNNAQRHAPRLGGGTTAGRLVLRHGIAATAGSPGRRQFLPPGKWRNCPEIDIDPPVPIGQSHDRGNSAAYQMLFFHEKKILLDRAGVPG